MTTRRILITAALPYANGAIHLGHLLEMTQTDTWSRFLKMQGHEVYFICGDDTHGTAIMIAANKRKITPEQLIEEVWNSHFNDLTKFNCDLSHYTSTHSKENQQVCHEIFKAAQSQNLIGSKNVEQLYCDHDKMFLPDRFVKGTCPKCKTPDQYGDSCEVCAATYSPSEMIAAACAVCGKPPIKKSSEHLFFELEKQREFLAEWLPGHTSKEIGNKMKEWFGEALRPWDISRDAPYFGINIPGYPDKFFYVWMDAPMGYISGTRQFCEKNRSDKNFKLNFDDVWRDDTKFELYHFIGKDIVYFHTLFWPALLKTGGYRTPNQVFVHGYLTLNGQKISKSKGTQLQAQDYLSVLPADYLRYYLAAKLNPGVDDMDLNLAEFAQKINSELVGKITNLASRGAQMLGKSFDSQMSATLDPAGALLIQKMQTQSTEIARLYEARDFAKVVASIRDLADEANRYFDELAPWKLIKVDPEQTRQVLTTTLNLFRGLAIMLKPIMPSYALKCEALFGESPWSWSSLNKLQFGKIKNYEHLASRVEPEIVEKLTAFIAQSAAAAAKPVPASTSASVVPLKAEIEIDQFNPVDLRVGLIKEASAVPEADKLLRLLVDLGPLGERQIFAGIKSAYSPENLVGRKTVVVANLKPRKMKFGMSEGMVLAAGAGAGGKDLFILSPDAGAQPGDPVK